MQAMDKDLEQDIPKNIQDISQDQINNGKDEVNTDSWIDEISSLSGLKLFLSGFIAIVLWLGTAGVIATHVYTVTDFSYKISQVETGTQTSKEEVENIQKSIGAVDGTAKGLYSFLTPFAAAVTAFFFNEAIYGKGKKHS
jgi:hypothetical protein